MPLPISDFGKRIVAKRAGRGVRAAAVEVDISPATLSRVENGHMPDLVTFAKICKWLGVDPREFLGMESDAPAPQRAVVHFRKKKTVSQETAASLGALILAAQEAVQARESLIGKR